MSARTHGWLAELRAEPGRGVAAGVLAFAGAEACAPGRDGVPPNDNTALLALSGPSAAVSYFSG